MKWLLVFVRIKKEKKLDVALEVAAEALAKVQEDVRKHSKIPKRESVESKAVRKLELVAANTRLVEAKVEHGRAIGALRPIPPATSGRSPNSMGQDCL